MGEEGNADKRKRRRGCVSLFGFVFTVGLLCSALPMLIGINQVSYADSGAERATQARFQVTPPPPPRCEDNPGFYTAPAELTIASGSITGREQVLLYAQGAPFAIRFDGGSAPRSIFCESLQRVFYLRYPDDWRVITGEDEPPARILLVPPEPDDAEAAPVCTLIRVGDQPGVPLPALPDCDPAALRQTTRVVRGVPFTLLAPRDAWNTYLPVFDQVVASADVQFPTPAPRPSPTPTLFIPTVTPLP